MDHFGTQHIIDQKKKKKKWESTGMYIVDPVQKPTKLYIDAYLDHRTVNDFNLKEWAANYWTEGGCPRDKLVIGLATYGRSFTLESATDHGVKAPARGGGPAGMFTRESGFLSYYEVSPI